MATATKPETKKTQSTSEEKKATPNLEDLLLVKGEATRIYNFMVFINEVWRVHDEEGRTVIGMQDTIRINTIIVYMMRQHSPAEPIRARFSALVQKHFLESPSGFMLFSTMCALSPTFTAAQAAFADEEAITKFLTKPKVRTPYLKLWLPKIQTCLDRLRDLYLKCGDVEAKTYAEDYKQVQADAEKHIWPKLWNITPAQAQRIQDYTKHFCKFSSKDKISVAERKVQWTLYLDAFQKLT